jgi:hypothetical protein
VCEAMLSVGERGKFIDNQIDDWRSVGCEVMLSVCVSHTDSITSYTYSITSHTDSITVHDIVSRDKERLRGFRPRPPSQGRFKALDSP